MHRFTARLKALRRRLADVYGHQSLARVQAFTPLQTFVAARDKDAHKPDYADLAYLWRTVLRHRPRIVLEYGSGCSTLVCALALQRTGQAGHLLSLESDPAWAAQTWHALPRGVRATCQVLVSPLEAATVQGVAGYLWEARPPDLVPDLIYLDGPGLTAAHAALHGLCALDLLQLEPSLPRGCRLIVDGRPGQTAFLRQHFRRSWQFRRHHLMNRHVFTLGQEE